LVSLCVSHHPATTGIVTLSLHDALPIFVVVEALDHALERGATIYAEIVGYGASSDGSDMVAPSGEGAQRCMQQALSTVEGPIDYINTHGTSTPVGDVAELKAIGAVFGDNIPPISSTNSLTVPSIDAVG